MAASGCIPSRDCKAASWLSNFARHLLEEREETFSVIQRETAERMAAAARRFDEAHLKANCNSSRTTVSIEAKNIARKDAEKIAREIMRAIRADDSLSDSQLLNLGMNPRPAMNRDGSPRRSQPVTRIDATPHLCFLGATADGRHALRAADSARLHSRAKPQGVQYLELRGVYTTNRVVPAPDLPNAILLGRFTRLARIEITHDPKYHLHAVTYLACFGRGTGKTKNSPRICGPWSMPVEGMVVVSSGDEHSPQN